MRGVTLPELTTTLLILGVVASVTVPPARRLVDRAVVTGAADRFASVHEVARNTAVARGRAARYEVDRVAGRMVLSLRNAGGTWDTLRLFELGDVRVSVSQATVTFNPLGIGAGASNATVAFSRGEAAETLTVSRTGRLRRW